MYLTDNQTARFFISDRLLTVVYVGSTSLTMFRHLYVYNDEYVSFNAPSARNSERNGIMKLK
jgi:hypothetical protein